MVLGEAFYGFCWNLLGASFYFIVIMTLKRYIFPLNSIPSYFNGGLSFVVFSIVEGNVNIFCGITKRYVLIISLFSIKKKLFEQDVIFVNDLLFEIDITILLLYLWGCRRNQTLPVITAFSSKVKIKYETETYICVKTKKMDKFNKKWALPLDSVP